MISLTTWKSTELRYVPDQSNSKYPNMFYHRCQITENGRRVLGEISKFALLSLALNIILKRLEESGKLTDLIFSLSYDKVKSSKFECLNILSLAPVMKERDCHKTEISIPKKKFGMRKQLANKPRPQNSDLSNIPDMLPPCNSEREDNFHLMTNVFKN